MIRGSHVAACEVQFAKDFLALCAAKISDAWEGVQPKVIRQDPQETDRSNLVAEDAPSQPLDDWVVIKKEEPHLNSQPFLLHINGEYLKALKKQTIKYGLESGTRKSKCM